MVAVGFSKLATMAPSYTAAVLLMAPLFQLCSTNPINEVRQAGRSYMSDPPCTSGPLGMESGAIPDSSITASASFSNSHSLPTRARLNANTYGWAPPTPTGHWIQVDLGDYNTAVTGVIVQGSGIGVPKFATTFTVQYSGSGESDDWLSVANGGEAIQFNGNTGTGREPVTVNFPVVVVARFLRIQPLTWVSYPRLRFEVLGCRVPDNIIRLVGGDGVLNGRVEIFHRGMVGVVCDEDWDFKEATVVCRQLGFLEALEAKTGSFFGESELPFVMSRVACRGMENQLAACPLLCTASERCNSSRQAGVVCKPNTIRLVGGSNGANGRVEIYQDQTWGTICDDDWDLTDATVVCRQLGFAGAEEAKSGAHFGQGEGPVHMDGVTCAGSESRITDCPSLCWEEVKCNHTQDAGVICRNGKASSLGQGDAV